MIELTRNLGQRARTMAVVAVLLLPAPAVEAFVTLRPETMGLEEAARWSAAPHEEVLGAGLYDGLSVAVEPGFAEKLALAVTGSAEEQDLADVEAATRAAFGAWENSVLRFRVELEAAAVRGPLAGLEIDVFAVPESDPVFQDNDFFGRTDFEFVFVEDRVLTNGTLVPGFAIAGADIFLNIDMISAISGVFSREEQPAALQRLLTHEIGHAIGLHHPNVFVDQNYDTDQDPLNEMIIDPADPLADLALSPNVDENAIMSNQPTMLEALLFTELRNDDRGGRDAFYPGPPPADCACDCNADGIVSLGEVLRGVNVGLGRAFFVLCPAADLDGDLHASVDEIVAGVSALIDGCPF